MIIEIMWSLLILGFICLCCYYGNKKSLKFYIVLGSLIIIVAIPTTIMLNSLDSKHTIKERTLNITKEREKITIMQKKLNKQITLISEAKDQYDATIKDLILETNKEKREYNISSLDGATERMLYDIRLIQEIDAYNTKLTELQKVTESGLEESIYMERRLTTKETMLMVTGNSKSLGKDIDNLLKKYNSYTKDLVIKTEDLKLKPLEEIWNQIQDESNPKKSTRKTVYYGPDFRG